MNGKIKNLKEQIDKLFNENNMKSKKTRYRYKDAAYRFCEWLGTHTNFKKFSNIKSKHIYLYTDYMQMRGYAPSTIKQDLSGIRFFHSMTNSKERLPDNEKLDLEKKVFTGVSRSWSKEELDNAIALAKKMNRIDVVMFLKLGYAFGTRLEEAVTLTVWQIKKAIENRGLYLENTKGNNPREVIVTNKESLDILYYVLKSVKSKERVFIGIGDATHKVKKSIQDWIRNHRRKFQNDYRISNRSARIIAQYNRENKLDKKVPAANLTAHGTRHSYAQQNFFSLLDQGEDVKTAKKDTSEKLGHHRLSITNVYIKK